MRIVVHHLNAVGTSAGGDQNILNRRRFARFAATIGQFTRCLPDFVANGKFWYDIFECAQTPSVAFASNAIPEFESDDWTPGRFPGFHQGPHLFSNQGITVLPKRLHPTRRVHKFHEVLRAHRIFMSSSLVMKVLLEPRTRVASAMRRRRLKSSRTVTTASFLVLAFVKRMASARVMSGISIVVFMLPL
jgi:hypothetical protein